MNTARYVVGVILLIALPPGVLLWFAIHPFVQFWRRFGAVWTYVTLSPFVIAWMILAFVLRERLIGGDLGWHFGLLVPVSMCLATGFVVLVQRRKHLTARIVVGLPELSRQKSPGKLLTEGIYSRVRHPRYLEVFLFSAAYAFFANYVGAYVVTVLSIPALYFVVVLEERELRERFGTEYAEYSRRVPRFLPLGRSSRG